MKSYFVFRDLFQESLNSVSVGIVLKSWKISNIETLTNNFFNETQVVSNNPQLAFGFCKVNPDGSSPQVELSDPNSWNPFVKCFALNFDTVNDLYRGQTTGSLSGNWFGQGILNLGVDVPEVMSLFGMMKGAFFIDIDYSIDLYIEIDIVTNIIGNVVYDEPQILRKYKIIWDSKRCYREFSYYSYQTGQNYNDNGLGFLAGLIEENFTLSPFVDFTGITCGTTNTCVNRELTRSYAFSINMPTVIQAPEIAFRECCYIHHVFADAGSNDDFKNDYSAFYHQRQLSNETVTFHLYRYANGQEYNLINNTYGDYFNFGHFAVNPDLKGYKVSWKKVLNTLGAGNYKIIKRQTIAGILFETESFVFTLSQYSSYLADKTVRIDTVMNGSLTHLGVDFTDVFWHDSIRVPGFFGRREPQFTEDNLIEDDYESQQISMAQSNEYKFQTNNIPECVKEAIIDFHLFANDIYFNDYNLNNSSYKYVKFGVKFSNNEGTDYGAHKRKSRLNLVFRNKFENRIKRNY